MHNRIFLLAALALLPLLTRAQAEPVPARSFAQRLTLTGTLGITLGRGNLYPGSSEPGSLGLGLWARLSIGSSGRFSTGLLLESNIYGRITGINGETVRPVYIPLLLTGSYALSSGRFRPFVGVGVGMAFSRRPGSDGFGSLLTIDRAAPVVGLHLGADYRLSDRWGLHARIQSDYIFRPNDNRINIPLHLGASFRLAR